MRSAILAALLWIGASTPAVLTQTQSGSSGPTFEAVSIRRNTAEGLGSTVNELPDGGFTMTNISVGTLIARAYRPSIPREMVGLPGWAMSEHYDVSATSSLSMATPADRVAMLRAMLTDRFSLAVHFENRELPAFDLVLARRDGRLGPGMKPVEVDCAHIRAERAAGAAPQPQFPDLTAPPLPCTVRIVGNRLEGETTLDNLAEALRIVTGRFVVNKAGLSGSYRMTMDFDFRASRRGPELAATPSDVPLVYTAVQEQLGLKLEPSRATREILIVDRLERPTPN